MNKHIAARNPDGTWRIDQIRREPHRIGFKGQARRKTIASGLEMEQAIARAAELNGSRPMYEKHPVRPRCRVGVRAA